MLVLISGFVAVDIQPGTQPYGYPAGPQCYVPPAPGVQYGPAPPGAAMYAPAPQPSTYVVHGGFDAGARFDGVSQPNIPVSFHFLSSNFT